MKKILFLFVLTTKLGFTQNYVADFNGSTGYIDMDTSLATGVRSVCLWFKPNITINSSTALTNTLMGRDDDANVNEVVFQIIGADQGGSLVGNLVFSLRNSLSSIKYVQSTSTTWLSTDWHYACGTIDATVGMKLYVDGVLEDSEPTCTSAWPAATTILSFGRWGDENIRYLNGRMEEVALWNRALSASEVSAKMCVPLNTSTETGLVAYYKMNEGSGSVINNQLPGFTGTVNGSTWVIDSTCVDLISVNEIKQNLNSVTLFPNPSAESIQFVLPENERGTFSLVLKDIAGKSMLQKSITVYNGNPITTNIQPLVTGTYFLTISNNNITYIGKFVKE